MITFYDTQEQARAAAKAEGLREKVLCFVVRGQRLLVFDHIPDGSAGVQIVGGGVEQDELPEAAAVRELWEESGLSLSGPHFLCSYLWHGEPPEAFKYPMQIAHAYAFAAPHDLPETWQHHADGHPFSFRWADLHAPGLDWEMGAALPLLLRQFYPSVSLADRSATQLCKSP
ncbi:NUDIX domain-containing protein [Deinococcus sp. VB142]|uniref:NUDIX domain-containing protein n=1 Tax=Deinococcus sp. VB142 TaxID=3112952 RepID=A0AAU6Q0M0_9DEIO